MGSGGKHPALVLQIALGHGDGRSGGGVEGRAGFQQAHDLGAAIAGALDDVVDLFLRAPAHLD